MSNNPPGPIGTLTQVTGGSMPAGTYTYAVSFMSANGESAVGTPTSITVTGSNNNAAVKLTNIPTGPAGTLGRKIHRTVAGGKAGDYFYVGTLNDNTSTTFVDGHADAHLGASAPSTPTTQFMGAFQMFEMGPPQASAQSGVINLGSGAFDGTSSGFFSGSANGTYLAINQASGSSADFARGQIAGTDVFKIPAATPAVFSLGVTTKTKAGTPADGDWSSAPPDGTIVVDTTANKIWARTGGAWKGVVIA